MFARLLTLLFFFHCLTDTFAQGEATIQQWRSDLQHCEWLDRTGERDSSITLLQKTLAATRASKNPELIAEATLALVGHFGYYELQDSLSKHLEQLIALAEKNKLLRIRIKALGIKACQYALLSRYKEAMEICEQAIQLARPLNDQHLNGLCAFWKGYILRISKDDTALPLPYFYQALDDLQAVKDTFTAIRVMMMIVSGESDEGKNKKMMQRVEQLSEVYPNKATRMRILLIHANQVSATEGIPLIQKALAISKELRMPAMIQHLYIHMSDRHVELKQYDKGLLYMDSSLMVHPLPDNGAYNYYQIYRKMGNLAKAVEYTELLHKYQDERKKTEVRSMITEWETKMNTREKEWEIAQNQKEIQNQKTRSWLLIAILLLTFTAGGMAAFAFLRQRKARLLLARQNETIKKQTEELQSLERLKSRFFANVSHELRTPLTLMLGPVNSVLKSESLREKDEKLLQLVQRNGSHLLKLVNEILDLSKLEVGRLEVKETAVNLQQFLHPIVAQFSSFGDSERVKLDFDFKADPELTIYTDTGKFEKIVHNFLSNALKFTPIGGKISFIVTEEGQDLLIHVQDTGSGIHPDDLPYIFDRFYQSRRPEAPTQGGTGIGLSLCRELAQLLDGKVWATSEWGKGSSFYFQFPKKPAPATAISGIPVAEKALPLVETHSANYTPVADKADRYAGAEKPVILLVEDNPDLREYMHSFLSETYRVHMAENGQEGWEALQTLQKTPDLIISDLMMPVMDGFQLLEKIKGADAFRHLPVIMLTARADIRVKLRALRIGVDDYLNKPFVEEELKARIANLLHNYRERMAYTTARQEKQKEEAGKESAPAPVVSRPVIAQVDSEWLKTVERVFSTHLADKNFNLEWAASQLNLSQRQLNRRLQQLTGLTPNQYTQEMRLQQARNLLLDGKYATIKETAMAVGFRDTPYFSELFQKRFGVTPSTYLR